MGIKPTQWVANWILNQLTLNKLYSFYQDLLCDSTGGGFLANRLKYLRSQHRQSQSACAVAAVSESEVDEESPASCEEDVEFLKFTVANGQNMDVIKSKLAATSEYRRKMMRDDHSTDLLEKFPYFFTSHELVSNQLKPCGYIYSYFYLIILSLIIYWKYTFSELWSSTDWVWIQPNLQKQRPELVSY